MRRQWTPLSLAIVSTFSHAVMLRLTLPLSSHAASTTMGPHPCLCRSSPWLVLRGSPTFFLGLAVGFTSGFAVTLRTVSSPSSIVVTTC